MSKTRLDVALLQRGLVSSRSQAENYIKLNKVTVNEKLVNKPGYLTSDSDKIRLNSEARYVSRAGLKLASVAEALNLNFQNKVVLDVGSSTGGFSDLSLQRGADKVIAVDVGTNQLHPSLHNHPRIELHEQTDIRDVRALSTPPDIVLIDVSFISLRAILPHIQKLIDTDCVVVAMVKPQFEAHISAMKHKGVIKNDAMRRQILKDFENWAKTHWIIVSKSDSGVRGTKGNQERFYVLKKL